MKNFVLIGAAGYIAPRHMKAIKETGNNLLAALDKHDSVGVLDSYFPEAHFFTEFERFDRHVEKLKRQGTQIDFVSVCSPNYLHDSHIRFGLRIGADVICEKPVVLNPWNVDALAEIEKETGGKVSTIFQLRMHPSIISLREKILSKPAGKKHKINLKYITARGHWYHNSWKGDVQKSGGITTNIGLHFFDMLLWIFGDVVSINISQNTATKASGSLSLQKADVDWFLSIDNDDLPVETKRKGNKAFRSLIIDSEEVHFNEGFDDLHTRSYYEILGGHGITMEETRKGIQLVHDIRNVKI
ncbi:MAG: Gfo/Idh/MocA family oxidoreductase [Chitinophagaceae bacterium]|nr:Gfo/Idh/MocA family oxidoreductase [Chitinophagaceae bacterium]